MKIRIMLSIFLLAALPQILSASVNAENLVKEIAKTENFLYRNYDNSSVASNYARERMKKILECDYIDEDQKIDFLKELRGESVYITDSTREKLSTSKDTAVYKGDNTLIQVLDYFNHEGSFPIFMILLLLGVLFILLPVGMITGAIAHKTNVITKELSVNKTFPSQQVVVPDPCLMKTFVVKGTTPCDKSFSTKVQKASDGKKAAEKKPVDQKKPDEKPDEKPADGK